MAPASTAVAAPLIWPSELRFAPRIPVGVPVTLTINGQVLKAEFENLSVTGAKIVASVPAGFDIPKVGTPVEITAHVGGGEQHCVADVRWGELKTRFWSHRLGIGVQFTDPDDAWGNFVQDLLEQYMGEVEPVCL